MRTRIFSVLLSLTLVLYMGSTSAYARSTRVVPELYFNGKTAECYVPIPWRFTVQLEENLSRVSLSPQPALD